MILYTILFSGYIVFFMLLGFKLHVKILDLERIVHNLKLKISLLNTRIDHDHDICHRNIKETKK
jgi:hypothetical protein